MSDPNIPTPGYQPQPSNLDLPPLPQPNVPTGPTGYGQPTPGYAQPPAAAPGYGQSQPGQGAAPGYGQAYQQPPQPTYPQPSPGYSPMAPYGAAAPDADAEQNKVMAVLAYLGFLVLVPLLAAKNSPFARFHAGQGLLVFGCEIVLSILANIFIGNVFIGAILGLVSLGVFALVIIGIIHAVKGEKTPLPLIGGIQLIK